MKEKTGPIQRTCGNNVLGFMENIFFNKNKKKVLKESTEAVVVTVCVVAQNKPRKTRNVLCRISLEEETSSSIICKLLRFLPVKIKKFNQKKHTHNT
jgi:hypothetical protein